MADAPAGWPAFAFDERFTVAVFAQQSAVSAQEVIDLWVREKAMTADEARRRADELIVVATDQDDTLAGVATAYLARQPQLRLDLWHIRAFVAPPHRGSHVATQMALAAGDELERRFVEGSDPRAMGAVVEVESEVLIRNYPWAWWWPSKLRFVGVNERGDHVRVRYFAGALAPDPPR